MRFVQSRGRFFAVVLAAALALSGLAGCVKKPTMHLNHAEISGVQFATFPPSLGIRMTVVVDVYNPNSYDVAVRAVRGQVMMADKYPLPVDFKAPGDGVWLPGSSTTQVRVPVEMPVQLAIALVREAFQSPTIGYHMTGKADVTGTRTFQLEKDDYSVDEVGTITREQMQAIIPSSFLR
jgi:LEA14-like dessication related protein